MNNNRKSEMVVKQKNKVLSCSTPEHKVESTYIDSDSIYDSGAGSPVPFICTQDAVEGGRDVVWNFNTPPSKSSQSNMKPTVRRRVNEVQSKVKLKTAPKRRGVKMLQKKNEVIQDLISLNQNLVENLPKKLVKKETPQSEDDIFSETIDSSPRSTVKYKNHCLRKNVLSSKFVNTEAENALESDDSLNEDLIKISQMVEEKIINKEAHEAKGTSERDVRPNVEMEIPQDSMDVLLCTINLDSPAIKKLKKSESPKFNNDSFDNLIENLNDSALERLSQMPAKNEKPCKRKDSMCWEEEEVAPNESPNKSTFGRHNSMPESPLVGEHNKPSTSGMAFGRCCSMPFNKSAEDEKVLDSPLRCTPDEIKKKHQQAKEKLFARRQLPFTSSVSLMPSYNNTVKNKPVFTYKIPKSKDRLDVQMKETTKQPKTQVIHNVTAKPKTPINIKLLIEKKRQEALMKLRRRQLQSKSS